MLSWDDALDFSTQKRGFLWGFFSVLLLVLFMVSVAIFLHYKFGLLPLIHSTDSATIYHTVGVGILGRLFTTAHDMSFWKTLYPIALTIVALSLATLFVFFAQELILAKKKLFNLPSRFSFPFFVRTLIKILILFLPIAIPLYFYAHTIIHSFISFSIRATMKVQSSYHYPFSTKITFLIIGLCILYLYYTMALFLETFSFKSLLKARCFFKHLKTVVELFVYHFLTFLFFFGAWNVLLLVDRNLASPHVCAPFLTIYFLFIAFTSKFRLPLLLPVFLYIFILGGCYYIYGIHFIRPVAIPLLVGTLTLNLFFICCFVFLSTMAHLFAQTTFVFHFNKTPARDEKLSQPKNLRRIEEIYDEYLDKHQKGVDKNFFNDM